jgi:formamidopyrimidine-DNA glycosylase
VPEGHTIHRLARDHGRLLAGRVVSASSPQGRFAVGAAVLDGRELRRIEAYGKHLFYRWDGGAVLHVHLGLFGSFRTRRGEPPAAPGPAVRLRLAVDGLAVDLSGPTDCSLGDESDRDRIVARLGPDPLRADADPDRFLARVGRSRAPIGGLLLDQSVIAGVGNVYRAEALFVCGIDPERPGASLDADARTALWDTVGSMLRAGVKANRIVTVDRAELGLPPGARHRRGETTYAYKRRECLRCGSAIRWFPLANRPCYACPGCQR